MMRTKLIDKATTVAAVLLLVGFFLGIVGVLTLWEPDLASWALPLCLTGIGLAATSVLIQAVLYVLERERPPRQ